MSDQTLMLVLTLVLGGGTLALLLAPLRRRSAAVPLDPLGDAPAAVPAPAIDAATEIAFDRATGKLTDADYAVLAERYGTADPVPAEPAAAPPSGERPPVAPPVPSAAPAAGFCFQCGVGLLANARFCHVCGATVPVSGATAPVAAPAAGVAPQRPAAAARATAPVEPAAPAAPQGSLLPWGIGFIVLLAGIGWAVGASSEDVGPAPGAPGAAEAPFAGGAGGGGGAPPDISNMTPRERADRLFGRIRAAAQAGDQQRVATFLPMALAAYDMLPPGEKDADARFAQGTLAELAGTPEAVAAQADSILAERKTHLLGLILRWRAATMRNDAAQITAAKRALLDAQAAEQATPRPEYEKNKGAIAQAIEEARKAP
jgi:hypothetical protein